MNKRNQNTLFWLTILVVTFTVAWLSCENNAHGQTVMYTGMTCPDCGRPTNLVRHYNADGSSHFKFQRLPEATRIYSTTPYYSAPSYGTVFTPRGSYAVPNAYYGAPIYNRPTYRRDLFGRYWRVR